MKLFTFYNLDAVSKNVYDPLAYACQFAPFLAALFLKTYGQVNQNTQSKMEEMLITWRNRCTGRAGRHNLYEA